MADNNLKIIKSIKLWTVLNSIESLILIIILLLITKDPKNAWLFGYSKSRVLVIGSVFVFLVILRVINGLSSRLTSNDNKPLKILRTHSSTGPFLELICGCCIFVLFASSNYLNNIFLLNQPLEPIHIRIIPIVVFVIVFFFQVFAFSVFLRLLLEEEKLVLNNVIRFSTFPFIREKIYLYVYSVISSAAMRLAKPFLIVIFVFSPVLITFSLIFAIFQTTPLSYIPASSDEIDYWHETQTFVDYGFSGGQYAYHELPAPLEFTGFGVHGPAFPVLYGIFGKIFGWEYYTGVLINLLLVTLALVIFVFLGNLDRKQLLSGIILIGTYWPLLLYLPTNMAESLNHAIAIVISVLFFLQLRNKENNNKVTLAIFIILVVSMMIRVTWSLLFFPLFLFMIDNDKDYKLLGAIILSVAGILLGFIYTRNFYAPFPMVFRSMLDGQRSLPELFLAAKIQVFRNFQNLFFEADTPFFIQAFRYQILGISVYLIYKLIRYFTKGESIKGLIRSELSFHFLNIVVPFIGVVTLFEVVDTRDYRNLAVSLLLSALVLLLFSRYKYILPFILVNGVLIVSFIPGYAQQRSSNFIYDKEIIETFSNRISPHVSFDETKSNRWCNTLGFIKHRKVPFIAVDSGIGHSSVDDVSEDTKSKYLLLPDEYVNANLSKIEALGLVELEKTNLGVLYLNPNSDCE